ncbi:MAG: glycosyltransferase family 2 protein [Proteobacteria bacterium]|nr:glycosyltransferase family 2 protein [Pseudomonadota bacterium]
MKLSVIMPLYNVEETIREALDSVLMQEVNFEYEIICVDDKSTDKSLSILKEYQQKYPQIKIIENENNQGNAYCFRAALKEAAGDYFCVLDGDDFYSVKYKLQRQVDFFDSDIRQEYVAVAHKYLRLLSNGEIAQDNSIFNSKEDYSYFDFIRRGFYFHTSTHMYRNIFKDRISPFFVENRGDMPRTFVTQFYTYGKVKALDFVGSVYRYNEKGIWSHMSPKEQTQKNNTFWERVADFQSSQLEKSISRRNIKDTSKLSDQVQKAVFATWTIQACFDFLKQRANTAAFSQREFIFKRLYKSELIDSFCETLGRIELNRRGFSPLRELPQNDNILINVSYLNRQGGGIYSEIKDLISIYADKKVFLLFNDISDASELQDGILEDLDQFKDFLTIIYNPEQGTDKLKSLFDIVINTNPSKIYHYCGHNMCYVNALIQSGLSKNIVVFSIDHGFSLGLDNSSIDCIITKTPCQYAMLHSYYGNKVIYIPVWNEALPINNYYLAFKQHNKLITATAAARYYKFEGGICKYDDFVVQLLTATQGKHIHYGPIPEDNKKQLMNKLEQNHISSDRFIHIEWAENLPQSLIDNNVDLFITPFPVGSAKIAIMLEAAGIPLICFRGDTRIESADYVAPSALIWNNLEKLFELINSLSVDKLSDISIKEQEYFNHNNNLNILSSYLRSEKNFETIYPAPYFYDNRILDIREVKQFIEQNIQKPQIDENKEKRKKKLSFKNKIRYKIWKHFNKKLQKKGII